MQKLILTVCFLFLFFNCAFAKPTSLKNDLISYQVGQITVTIFPEAESQGKANILINATPESIDKYLDNGSYPSAVNCFLLSTTDRHILVDTGFGPKFSQTWPD